MGIFKLYFGQSPFPELHRHTKKVHDCVELLRPLADALITEDYEKIEELHKKMSQTEHEADIIKTEIRDKLVRMYFLGVGKHELSEFLAYQDDVADAAEDFAVVLLLRKTKLPEEIKESFMEFVKQVINVSEQLLDIAYKLSTLAGSAFAGPQADQVLEAVDKIGEGEWKADKLARKFAMEYYEIEDKMDPVTIQFLDKYCSTLSAVANNAEKSAKFLRLIVRRK